MKFNDQNGCTEKEVEAFMKMNYKNRVFFTCREWNICGLNKFSGGSTATLLSSFHHMTA
ncbi:MAG: hypothetical protein ACI4S2_13840 [Lachnospiraceae bacterium]